MHFDKIHNYNKNNKLFVDFTNILDANKPISQLNTNWKSYKTNLYFDESCALLPLLNIPDLVKNEEYNKKDTVTSEN